MKVWTASVFAGIFALFGLLVRGQTVLFEEVSEQAGLNGENWLDDWRPTQNRYFGSTVFDANGDGYLDLALPNHGDNTEVYFGSADGFTFVNPRTLRRDVHTIAACDWDNDGDEDFIVIRGGRDGQQPNPAAVYEVDGTNIKEIGGESIGINEGIRGRSSAFFDVDGDGDKDLLLVNRHQIGEDEAHVIYENLGNGQFVEHTDIGFEEVVAAWFCLVDLNNDRFMDVILMGYRGVEVMMGTGTFEFTKQNWRLPGAADLGGVRSCAEFDVDGDGKMEVYFTRGDTFRFMRDRLYRNNKGILEDITDEWQLPAAGKHSHITYLDADNDGRMDAYLSVKTWYQEARRPDIFLYNRGTHFEQVDLSTTGLHLPFNADEDGDNAVAFDYNNDGWVDLLVGNRAAPWRLYENRNQGNGNNWARIAIGRPRAGVFRPTWYKDPWGALVRLQCGGKVFVQRTGTPGMSHSTSNILRPTFGLGTCTKITSLKVFYIGGLIVNRWGGKVNREIVVGLLNCPGVNCDTNIAPCEATCSAPICERTDFEGNRVYCPV